MNGCGRYRSATPRPYGRGNAPRPRSGSLFRFSSRISAPLSLGVVCKPLQPLKARPHPLVAIRGEMEPGMNDDPSGAKQRRGVDIGFEIAIDGVADQRRVLGDVDRRCGMQAEMDAVPLAPGAHRRRPCVVDRAERVGAGIELNIDKAHPMLRRPGDGVLESQFAPDIDPDPVAQCHRMPLHRSDRSAVMLDVAADIAFPGHVDARGSGSGSPHRPIASRGRAPLSGAPEFADCPATRRRSRRARPGR